MWCTGNSAHGPRNKGEYEAYEEECVNTSGKSRAENGFLQPQKEKRCSDTMRQKSSDTSKSREVDHHSTVTGHTGQHAWEIARSCHHGEPDCSKSNKANVATASFSFDTRTYWKSIMWMEITRTIKGTT